MRGAEQGADRERCSHRDRSPEDDSRRAGQNRCAARARGRRTQGCEAQERCRRHHEHSAIQRRQQDARNRQCRSDGEGRRRGERRLEGARGVLLDEPELVSRVSRQGISRHELARDGEGESRIDSAAGVDRRQLLLFAGHVGAELGAFAGKVGALGVGLRAHRNILTGSHREGARDQPGHPREKNVSARGMSGGDAHYQTRGRDDAIIRAEHRGPQPTDARAPMQLFGHSHLPVAAGSAQRRALGSPPSATTLDGVRTYNTPSAIAGVAITGSVMSLTPSSS
jgi:hypothetical protein